MRLDRCGAPLRSRRRARGSSRPARIRTSSGPRTAFRSRRWLGTTSARWSSSRGRAGRSWSRARSFTAPVDAASMTTPLLPEDEARVVRLVVARPIELDDPACLAEDRFDVELAVLEIFFGIFAELGSRPLTKLVEREPSFVSVPPLRDQLVGRLDDLRRDALGLGALDVLG